MKATLAIALLVCAVVLGANAQQPTPASGQQSQVSPPESAQAPQACLIVKHKGTVGRRLLWTALIGVPIAPGAKYDLVDSMNLKGTKSAYKGKEIEQLQAQGVRVIILEKNYKPEDLQNARAECRQAQAPQQQVPPPEKKQ